MSKKNEISAKTLRQIEVLSKYYDIDLENRVVNLELCYESVDDIFADDIVGKHLPKFKKEILQRVSEIMESFPDELSVNLKLDIGDYKGLDPEVVFESFQDSLELLHHGIYKEKSFRWIEATILALVSVGILFIRRLGLTYNFILDSDLITEMLDITAWVFLWQGVTVLFLNNNAIDDINFTIITKLRTFTLGDKNGMTLMFMNHEELSKNWIQVSKAEKTSKKLLLIAGGVALATGTVNAVDTITMMVTPDFYQNWLLIVIGILDAIIVVVSIIGGIGAISVFREKGPLKKAVPFVAYCSLIIVFLFIAVCVITIVEADSINAGIIVRAIITLIINTFASIFYFVAYLILRNLKKKGKKVL